jgi:pimeloyl-ACP methyl ester carboxylesterase
MTEPVPNWPGRMIRLPSGQQVWVTETNPGGARPAAREELVVCVHGMTGDATNWTDLMAELAPEFDAVALDLPGSGFSPPPRRRRGYSITALAGTVIELIEALGRESGRADGPGAGVHLVGNSMGGAVSVRVAARRPDLVRTLTLVSAALPDRRLRRQTAHFPLVALPLLGDGLVRKFGRIPAEHRIAGVLRVCYYDPSAIHPARVAAAIEELRRRDGLGYDIVAISSAARTLVAETLRPRAFSLWRDAERLQVPSLVLFGANDQLVSPDLARRAARAFRGARVMVLPDTGHLGQMEHPATVASLFREMVSSARSEPGRGEPPGNAGHRDPVDA